jgi:hypothetical protein
MRLKKKKSIYMLFLCFSDSTRKAKLSVFFFILFAWEPLPQPGTWELIGKVDVRHARGKPRARIQVGIGVLPQEKRKRKILTSQCPIIFLCKKSES